MGNAPPKYLPIENELNRESALLSAAGFRIRLLWTVQNYILFNVFQD